MEASVDGGAVAVLGLNRALAASASLLNTPAWDPCNLEALVALKANR